MDISICSTISAFSCHDTIYIHTYTHTRFFTSYLCVQPEASNGSYGADVRSIESRRSGEGSDKHGWCSMFESVIYQLHRDTIILFSLNTAPHLTEDECIICSNTCNMQGVYFRLKFECATPVTSQKFFKFKLKLVAKVEDHPLSAYSKPAAHLLT
jgi:hypothetical protein